ncbi:hypothetical protein B0A55_07015 [Friedmanniomyces simplex]|uniref:Uncharacterized protein n=1 Tax=Friedmanniomyces simplex TaxID=329884 RepID=A0A4U0X4V0_9PEZI|nr:hypothetical protein B0A55_07015 [Friedmanniomyces simplex]
MDFITITTIERALLADGQAQIHAIAHKLAHNDTLLRDLDASMRRLVEYMPVVESARREAFAWRKELVEELREFVMELLVCISDLECADLVTGQQVAVVRAYDGVMQGMHDLLRYDG